MLFISLLTQRSPSIWSLFPPSSLFLLIFWHSPCTPLQCYNLQENHLSHSITHWTLTESVPDRVTLVRLRAALSLPPGVRFLSWTSSSSTSCAMARTVDGTSPGRRSPLVCSASSLATIAAVSPERSCEPNRATGWRRDTARVRRWEVKMKVGKRRESWRGREEGEDMRRRAER